MNTKLARSLHPMTFGLKRKLNDKDIKMAKPEFKSALIIGTGNGLSSSFARRCAAEGWRVSLAARDPEHLSDFCKEIGAKARHYGAKSPNMMMYITACI